MSHPWLTYWSLAIAEVHGPIAGGNHGRFGADKLKVQILRKVGAKLRRDTSVENEMKRCAPRRSSSVVVPSGSHARGIFCNPGPAAGEEQCLPSPAADEGAPLAPRPLTPTGRGAGPPAPKNAYNTIRNGRVR